MRTRGPARPASVAARASRSQSDRSRIARPAGQTPVESESRFDDRGGLRRRVNGAKAAPSWPRKGGLSGSAPTDASGHQSGSGRGRSLPVALRSRGSVSARDALNAIALASCAPTEAQKRSCGRRWADRSRRRMGCVAACGPEAVALSRATASTRWLVCGAGGSVAPGGAAEFRIVRLEQHFPDSDEIAGRRPEREPR